MRKGWLALALAWVFSITGKAEGEQIENAQNLQIKIRVYNFARVAPEVLAKGKEEAGLVLERVGIQTHWLDCAGAAADPGCETEPAKLDFAVRVLPRWVPHGAGIPRSALGLALIAEDGGTVASIYFGRVIEIAAAGLASQAQVLGHGIAHELGHLLMGSNGHASLGIMRPEWKRQDLENMARRSLNFTPDQRKSLREAVHRRGTAGVLRSGHVSFR